MGVYFGVRLRVEFGIYQGADWQAYSGSILGFPGGGPGWPFCGAIKAAEARGEVLKIIGVQIVVYGFRPRFVDGIRTVILFSLMGHLLQAYLLYGIRTTKM